MDIELLSFETILGEVQFLRDELLQLARLTFMQVPRTNVGRNDARDFIFDGHVRRFKRVIEFAEVADSIANGSRTRHYFPVPRGECLSLDRVDSSPDTLLEYSVNEWDSEVDSSAKHFGVLAEPDENCLLPRGYSEEPSESA